MESTVLIKPLKATLRYSLLFLIFFGQSYLSAAEIVYVPPEDQTVTRRSGSSSRGMSKGVILNVLAPQHTGLVINSQPTLYWAVSGKIDRPIRFTLIDANPQSIDDTQPIIKKYVRVQKSGIHSINLKKQGIHLAKNKTYEWSVALDDPKRRTTVFASSTIKRVNVSPTLAKKIDSVHAKTPRRLPYLYAKKGYWYDTIDSLSLLIKKYPSDGDLKDERSSLLTQVALSQISD